MTQWRKSARRLSLSAPATVVVVTLLVGAIWALSAGQRPNAAWAQIARQTQVLLFAAGAIGAWVVVRRASASAADAADSVAHFGAILDTAVDGIIRIDTDGTILLVNRAAARMFGYTAEELVGRDVTVLMSATNAEQHRKQVDNYLRTGQKRIIGIGREVEALRRDGSPLPIEISISEVSHHGRRTFTAILRDVSQRHAMDEQLRTRHRELEASRAAAVQQQQQLKDSLVRSERLMAELRMAKDAADVATRAKSQFLANMSHEIRTPITAILGFAEILKSDAPGRVTLSEAVDAIERNAAGLLGVLSDVLEIVTLDSDAVVIRSEAVDPTRVIEEALDYARPGVATKGLTLTVDYATPLPRAIQSDAARLRQIITILIGNAVKFTELGAIRVVVECDRQRRRLSVAVIDSGVGIPPDRIADVFEPFIQADDSGQRRFGGAGLGLAIARRMARLLGGEIETSSEVGQGSVFCLLVPTGELRDEQFVHATGNTDPAAVRAAPLPAAPAHDPVLPPGCRVLVAEDGPDNQRLLQFILERAGAHVVVVDTGRRALDVALGGEFGRRKSDASEPFDIVLMDMQMPEMDGYEATRRLRAAKFNKPIIAVTAHALAGDREKCLAAGCDDYHSKPVQRDRLLAAIRALLVPSPRPERRAPSRASAATP